MRGKPDLKDFKDPTDFLEGGAADRAEKEGASEKKKKGILDKPKTQQKIFRLSVDVVNALKLHVAQQQVDSGKRTTETEIVETLLRHYLDSKI